MIKFNELYITPDRKHLIIDASVQSLSYYDNVYIDSVQVDTQKTFREDGPSIKPFYFYQVDQNAPVYTEAQQVYTGEDNAEVFVNDTTKNVRLIVDIDGVSDSIFFVYVITGGDPAPDTPCGMKNPVTMGIAFNKYLIYLPLLNTIKSIERDCEIPDSFLKNAARYEAFKVALELGNYPTVIKYWEYFTKHKEHSPHSKPCGCHGTHR